LAAVALLFTLAFRRTGHKADLTAFDLGMRRQSGCPPANRRLWAHDLAGLAVHFIDNEEVVME
jgi:hypothetical protein